MLEGHVIFECYRLVIESWSFQAWKYSTGFISPWGFFQGTRDPDGSFSGENPPGVIPSLTEGSLPNISPYDPPMGPQCTPEEALLTAYETGIPQNIIFLLLFIAQISERIDDHAEDDIQDDNDQNDEECQIVDHSGHEHRLVRVHFA